VTATRRPTTFQLAGAVWDLLGWLTAAGLRATADIRNVNPPGVYVEPPLIAWRFGRGYVDLSWSVWLVVPNTGRDAALKNLGPLLIDTYGALTAQGCSPTDASFSELTAPDGGPPMPAYLMNLTTRHQFLERITP
jgi:hypothetical protein